MNISTLFVSLLATASLTAAQTPGYLTGFSTVNNTNLSFGKHYAVLNFDMINGLVGLVSDSAEGKAWINSTATWIDAVHAKHPRPLEIFTRIYFSNANRPEIGPQTPFAAAVAALGNATSSSPQSQIYPAFHTDDQDVILQKSRYYGGFGNPLEEILSSQLIDTVIISGIRTSGVIVSSVFALFDQNYQVYVIGDNIIESGSNGTEINTAILTGVIPKLPANVITQKQALAALQRSG